MLFLIFNFLAILSTIDCMNIEVRENLQKFIQSPLVDVVGVPNKTDAKFRVLPVTIKPSFFGYNLISQEGQLWIGAPKAVGNFSVEHDTPKHNIKDAGGIFQCGVSGSSMFRSRETIPTTCDRISPDAFAEGDHFGLNIQEPRNPRNLQACSATRLLGCTGGAFQPGFCFKSTDRGKTWSKPIDMSGVRCSKKTIDIMFVLDGSGSVGSSNFDKVKIWTNKVARHFHEYDRKTQIGVVQYSHYNKYKALVRQDHIKTEIELGLHEPNDFEIAMNKIELDGHTTYTGKALNKTIYDFQKSPRYDDPSNTKVIILVTDGKTNEDDKKNLGGTAQHLKNLGIITFAVGVGEADVDELKIITRNNTKRIYKVEDFTDLDYIVKQLQTQVISVTLEGSGTAVAASLKHQFGEIGFSSSTKVYFMTYARWLIRFTEFGSLIEISFKL